jgi:hypothetical protein
MKTEITQLTYDEFKKLSGQGHSCGDLSSKEKAKVRAVEFVGRFSDDDYQFDVFLASYQFYGRLSSWRYLINFQGGGDPLENLAARCKRSVKLITSV